MSTGGTGKQRTRSDLLRRLQVLKPTGNDIFLLALPDDYFTEGEGPNAVAVEFANAVMKASKRPVFIVQKGREELVYGAAPDIIDPRAMRPSAPPVAVPKARIHLPTGVKLDGI